MRATEQDYRVHLQQLLPTGGAWNREEGSKLTAFLSSFGAGLMRCHNRGCDLIEESDPRTTTELITDWERVAGLPEKCAPIAATIEERRAAVVAKITAQGGQSIAFFIQLAAALGYECTVEEFRPFTCETGCETGVMDEPWRFVWMLRAPETEISELSCEDDCQTAIRWWGIDILECLVEKFKPDHTRVIFAYGE